MTYQRNDHGHAHARTRREALGLATALLGAGTLGFHGPEPDGRCTAAYDAEYEAALLAAQVPDEPPDRASGPGLAGSKPRLYWARPLVGRYRVSARYGIPGDWLAGHHTGIDLAVAHGTPVRCVGAGTVVLARWSGAYGKAVTVRMLDGRYAVYGHLSRLAVRAGARVHTGQRLGRSGNTGRSTGPHLHLEIRARRHYGSDIDPVRYLAARGVRL